MEAELVSARGVAELRAGPDFIDVADRRRRASGRRGPGNGKNSSQGQARTDFSSSSRRSPH
jgi:hypothetical protein